MAKAKTNTQLAAEIEAMRERTVNDMVTTTAPTSTNESSPITTLYEVLDDLDTMPIASKAFKAEAHPAELALLNSMVEGKVKAIKLGTHSKRSFKTVLNGLAKANGKALIWKDGEGVVYFRLETEADRNRVKRTRSKRS